MSLKKIAGMTGLSVATVSHAINGTRGVSSQNRALVLTAARAIGYKPNLAGRTLRTQKSQTIALIIPSADANPHAGYFYMDVITGVRRKMIETHYELIISSYDLNAGAECCLDAMPVLSNHWVDGIILVPSAEAQKQIKAIRDLDLPFVLLDRRVDRADVSYVVSDNERGSQAAVKLLADCGWQRIGFIGGNLSTSTGLQRLNGYKSALRLLGRTCDSALVQCCNGFSYQKGMTCMAELLQQDADAVFVADNTMMMGAIHYLNESGIDIPGQMGIVGYDDFTWMAMMNPPITTVRQEANQLGYTAAEILFRRFCGSQDHEKVVLATSLTIRKSHGTCLGGSGI